jgi:endonuclease/exonuclease/phosphatase family metal-dependent hydrolase
MISVMTLNIWNDQGPWVKRSKLIQEEIEQLKPDLIGMQEVLLGEEVNLLEDLLSGTSYHQDFTLPMSNWPREGVKGGNAIASRWPILDRVELLLPFVNGDERRSALFCILDTPHGHICIAVTHLNWRVDHGFVRERQVVAIANQLKALTPRSGYPPILIGDFNSVPDSAEVRFLTGRQSLHEMSIFLRDAWTHGGDGSLGLTWSSMNPYIPRWLEPDRRIDYIFVGAPQKDGGGEILSCRRICDQPQEGVWPSDHFGLYAELETMA